MGDGTVAGIMESFIEREDRRLLGASISGAVIECADKVHRSLGPGLLEIAYRTCLLHELRKHGFTVKSEEPIPLTYDGVPMDCGFRADLLVDGKLLVELKAVERLLPIHGAQILTYMKLAGVRVGLLMSFNTPLLRQGVRRFVL